MRPFLSILALVLFAGFACAQDKPEKIAAPKEPAATATVSVAIVPTRAAVKKLNRAARLNAQVVNRYGVLVVTPLAAPSVPK